MNAVLRHSYVFATLLLSISSALLPTPMDAQGTGLVFDDSSYARVPLSAPLMRGDYGALPAAASLKAYTPHPGNQGDTGTCVGWATAYSARTIMLAKKNEWRDREMITAEAFSPSYIYNQIRSKEHNNCRSGVRIEDAMEVLKSNGVVKQSEFPFLCSLDVTSIDSVRAASFRIKDYKKLFDRDSPQKVLPIKKSLAEGKPIVIGIKITESFRSLYGASLWMPGQSASMGGHALTVIGYDDSKYGGAFELINSWGSEWGQGGFVWIRYQDFEEHVKYAFEMIEQESDDREIALEGEVKFLLSDGRPMNAKREDRRYVMDRAYPSGTQFQLRIANHQPAYVYALGADRNAESFRIFPPQESISAYLGYAKNNVAIPSEHHLIQMDENVGTDYMAVLYAREALDLEGLMEDMGEGSGDFTSRLYGALGSSVMADSNLVFEQKGEIAFVAPQAEGTVVPIIIEIEHVAASDATDRDQ